MSPPPSSIQAEENNRAMLIEWYRLQDGISVASKVEANGDIKLDGGENGIHIQGKVDAKGRVAIKGWVRIDGNVKGSNIKIRSDGPPGSKFQVRVLGKVEATGSVGVEGNVVL